MSYNLKYKITVTARKCRKFGHSCSLLLAYSIIFKTFDNGGKDKFRHI